MSKNIVNHLHIMINTTLKTEQLEFQGQTNIIYSAYVELILHYFNEAFLILTSYFIFLFRHTFPDVLKTANCSTVTKTAPSTKGLTKTPMTGKLK